MADDQNMTEEQWPLFSFLLVIMLLTVVGNGLVIAAIIRDRNLKKMIYYILASLAVCHVMYGVLVMSYTLAQLSKGACRFEHPLDEIWRSIDILLVASTLTHICMALYDCHYAVRKPLGHRLRKAKTHLPIYVTIPWVAALILAIPGMAVLGAVGYECLCWGECWGATIAHGLGTMITPCFIPILAVIALFIIPHRTMRRRKRVSLIMKDNVSKSGIDANGENALEHQEPNLSNLMDILSTYDPEGNWNDPTLNHANGVERNSKNDDDSVADIATSDSQSPGNVDERLDPDTGESTTDTSPVDPTISDRMPNFRHQQEREELNKPVVEDDFIGLGNDSGTLVDSDTVIDGIDNPAFDHTDRDTPLADSIQILKEQDDRTPPSPKTKSILKQNSSQEEKLDRNVKFDGSLPLDDKISRIARKQTGRTKHSPRIQLPDFSDDRSENASAVISNDKVTESDGRSPSTRLSDYMANAHHKHSIRISERIRQQRRLVYMIVAMFLTFGVLYLPHAICYTVVATCQSCRSHGLKIVFLLLRWLSYCVFFVNPIVYAITNQDMRNAMVNIFHRESPVTLTL